MHVAVSLVCAAVAGILPELDTICDTDKYVGQMQLEVVKDKDMVALSRGHQPYALVKPADLFSTEQNSSFRSAYT